MENQNPQPTNIDTSNTVSSLTQTPVNPPQAKSKFPRALILVIILFLLLAGSAAGFYVFKQQVPKQIACTEEAKVCPDGTSVGRTGPKCEFALCQIAKITPNPTADWQIYTGEGFTFKYPHTLKPTIIGTDKTIHVDYSEVIPANKPDGMEQGPGFSLSFLIKDLQASLKDSFDADFKNNSLLKEIVLKDTKLGEYSGFTFTAYSTYIYLSNNKDKYIVINYSVNDRNNKGYRAQIDQILSTFKFTDITTTPTPPNVCTTDPDKLNPAGKLVDALNSRNRDKIMDAIGITEKTSQNIIIVDAIINSMSSSDTTARLDKYVKGKENGEIRIDKAVFVYSSPKKEDVKFAFSFSLIKNNGCWELAHAVPLSPNSVK